MNSPNDPCYLKLGEIVRLLDLSKRTIQRLVATGKLPEPIRFSRTCVRWDRAAVLKAVEALKKRPA